MCLFLKIASQAELMKVNLHSVSAGIEIMDWERLTFLFDNSVEMDDISATLIYN